VIITSEEMDRNDDGLTPPPSGSIVLAKNTFDLKGRYYIVTGGTQGLGRRIAIRIAENGAEGITICGRNKEKGQKVKEELLKLGVKHVIFVEADLAIPDQARNVVHVAKSFPNGRLDGLINAAGIATRGNLEDTTVELWDHLFNVNVRAQFILTQEVSRVMKSNNKGGSIVNISSIAAHTGGPFIMAYSAAKGALNILTKNNAVELRSHKIRVNSINMGWSLTDGENELQAKEKSDENWIEKADKSHPFGRLLRADDIANVVGFLLSDAGSMITGTNIDVHPELVAGALPGTVG